MTERLTELFVMYRDGRPLHYHQDRSVFETWMRSSPLSYPPDRCEIVRFVPDAPGERAQDTKEG